MINNQHELGVAVILPGLEAPTDQQWQAIERKIDDVEMRVFVTFQSVHRPGWKCLLIPGATEETAKAIALKHLPNCLKVSFVTEVDDRLNVHASLVDTSPVACDWAPVRGPTVSEPWTGQNERKPWDYACEVTIPVMDTPDTLPVVVELLRAQTVKPFIVIVDTGSTPENWAKIEALRAPDVEVHSLRFNGVRHPSDFPAIACDLAMSACRTEKLVFMHADVFPRSKDSLERLLAQCDAYTPAVGYQMTEREHPGWEKVVSHTWTALHMPVMDSIGAGWSLRRLCTRRRIGHYPNSTFKNMPDTEVLLSDILEDNGITPKFIGTEVNFEQTVDDNIRHVRSLTGARLYAEASYRAKAEGWLVEALEEAWANLEAWSRGD